MGAVSIRTTSAIVRQPWITARMIGRVSVRWGSSGSSPAGSTAKAEPSAASAKTGSRVSTSSHTNSLSRPAPVKTPLRPRLESTAAQEENVGRRRSASTAITVRPRRVSARPSSRVTVVLPSPGEAEVTITTLESRVSEVKSRFDASRP